MRRTLPARAKAAGLFLALVFGSAPQAAAEPAPRSKIEGPLSLSFKRRLPPGLRRGALRGGPEAPVLIRLASRPTRSDVLELEALGASIERRDDGSPGGFGEFIAAVARASSIDAIASHPRVRRITLDQAPFAPPPPLDVTAAEIQATDAWRAEREPTGPLTGEGVIVCDIDSGIDPFHPLFFRADGGYRSWVDADGDGKFTPGTDAVDLLGDGALTKLRVLNSEVTQFWSPEPLFGSESTDYQIGMDWLYADQNGNSARDFGPDAGFTEESPTYGERLFVADDVNKNGILEVGEKIVALGSSKIKVMRVDKKKYRRGENLIDAPQHPDSGHGTGAAGVMVGGNLGLTRLVGIAPDAEIVMASNTDMTGLTTLANFCITEGARVVLHEYAPWIGYHLDGSSPMESLIDQTTAEGVSHINPAGNLSTSQKLFKKTIAAGEETLIPIEAPPDSPYGEFEVMVVSVLWREPSRLLSISVEDPTGVVKPAAVADGEVISTDWTTGVAFQSTRDDSARGTARVDIYVYRDSMLSDAHIPLGTWKLHVTDPTPPGGPGVEVIAYVYDERSGWGKGIFFPDSWSEDHLIGFPGTADHGLAVAAYTGHGFNGGEPGARAGYSGRGHRIDGVKNLWISAPDDPITSGYREGSQAVDFVYGGTSGASPHVAGAAALLIQADPSRTGDDVREAIRKGALVDKDVGAAPNEDFGNGKLRIYRSLFGVDPPGGSAPSVSIPKVTVELGETARAPIEASDPDEPAGALRVEVDRDYDGVYDEVITGDEVIGAPDALGVFTSKVRVTDATGRSAAALSVVEVLPKVTVPAEKPSLIGGGGCGCEAAGRGSERGAWALFALLLAAAIGRKKGEEAEQPIWETSTVPDRSGPPDALYENKEALLQTLNHAFCGFVPHNRALGLRVVDIGPGALDLLLPYAPHLVGDPETGILHGGAISALMDAAGGGSVFMAMKRPTPMATLDMRIDYLRPAEPGRDVTAHAHCYRMTRSVAFVRGVAYHDNKDRPIASIAATYMVGSRGKRPPDSAAGKQPAEPKQGEGSGE